MLHIEKIFKSAEEKPFMCEPLSYYIGNANSILLVADSSLNTDFLDKLISLTGDKLKAVISPALPNKYKNLEFIIDKNKIEDFKFFGANAGRAPILIHNSLFDYDLVIVLSKVEPDAFGGFLGSLTTLFKAITAHKTQSSIIKNALQDKMHSMEHISSYTTIKNPVFESLREMFITAGRVLPTFSINIPHNSDEAFCGDMFISQINAQNTFSIDNTLVNTKVIDDVECHSLRETASIIEQNCKQLEENGNLFLNGKILNVESKEYQDILSKKSMEDIIHLIDMENYMDVFYLALIKYYCSKYNVYIK